MIIFYFKIKHSLVWPIILIIIGQSFQFSVKPDKKVVNMNQNCRLNWQVQFKHGFIYLLTLSLFSILDHLHWKSL